MPKAAAGENEWPSSLVLGRLGSGCDLEHMSVFIATADERASKVDLLSVQDLRIQEEGAERSWSEPSRRPLGVMRRGRAKKPR